MRRSNFKYYCYFIPARLKSILRWIFLEWRRLGIKKDDIVVDLGGGGRPLLRANIIVDKSLHGLAERLIGFLDTGAFIVQADLSNLPFKDKSIDFGYSSHVVEHLGKLEESLQEMQRVCKRGFITCPSAAREQIMALKTHLWFVESKDGRLVFTRKPTPYPEYIGDFFDKLLTTGKKYVWYNFEESLPDLFFVNYFWKDKISYEVRRDVDATGWDKGESPPPWVASELALSFREKLLIYSSKIIRRFFSRRFDIEEVLCCPRCKGMLLIDKDFARCERCKIRFAHKDKRVFSFLDEESYE